MTLVKTKIESDESGITIYMWRKMWWLLGYWYPYGHTSKQITANPINDDTVSELLFNNLLSK